CGFGAYAAAVARIVAAEVGLSTAPGIAARSRWTLRGQLTYGRHIPSPRRKSRGACASRSERCVATPTGARQHQPIEGAFSMAATSTTVSMRELLEAGVHFGHQTRRWNPKMRRFIFAERGGIYIIDLTQTSERLDEAQAFLRNVAERGGTV